MPTDRTPSVAINSSLPVHPQMASYDDAKPVLSKSMDCLVQAMLKNKTSAQSSDCFFQLATVSAIAAVTAHARAK